MAQFGVALGNPPPDQWGQFRRICHPDTELHNTEGHWGLVNVTSFPDGALPKPINYDADYRNVHHVFYPDYIFWSRPRNFYLSFLPVNKEACYNSTLFRPLKDVVVFKRRDGQWQLTKSLREQWKDLERMFIPIVKALCSKFYTTPPYGFQLPDTPTYARYLVAHHKEEFARMAGEQARDAFLLYGALCSFLIAHADHQRYARLFARIPSWVTFLQEDLLADSPEVHPFVNLLLASWITDQEIPRHGAWIDCRFPQSFADAFPVMRRFGIPIRLFWGNNPNLRPSYDNTLASFESYKNVNNRSLPFHYDDPVDLDDAPIPNDNAPNAPNPIDDVPHTYVLEAQSGQRKGEDVWDYLGRIYKRDLARLKTESLSQRTTRLERTRQILGATGTARPVPGRQKGPAVWEWVKLTGWPTYVRQYVPRGDVSNTWEQYSNYQKRYNTVDNCWDLCEAFGPSDPDFELEMFLQAATPTEDESDRHVAEDDNDQSLAAETPDLRNLNRFVHNCVISNRRASLFADTFREPQFLHILAHRYGISYTSEGSIQSHMQAARDRQELKPWSDICRALVHSANADDALDPKNRLCAQYFFTPLLSHHPPSTSLCDMVTGSYIPLERDRADCMFIRFLSRSTYKYIVKSPADVSCSGTWELAVEDPLTALQIVRCRWRNSREEIAHELLRRGIPFFILHPLDCPISPPKPSPSFEFFEEGYCPSRQDYDAYVATRDIFFAEGRHAYAALLAGGLLWRLALDSGVTVESALKSVPLDVNDRGAGESCGKAHYWRDALTELEEAMIVGVYKVYTGTRTHTSQVADASWWPKVQVFESSGLWMGYWTPDCEKWYQGRLALTQGSQIRIWNSTAWKRNLKKDRRCSSQIRDTSEALAQEWLATRGFLA